MTITINNEVTRLASDNTTLRELLQQRELPEAGTAVAVNNRLIPRSQWDRFTFNDGDDVTLITAAFGG